MPENISDAELLGKYFTPENLSLADGSGKLNVNNLDEHSLGKAPTNTTLTNLTLRGALFLTLYKEPDHKWLWASLVGELILQPYDLNAPEFLNLQPWRSTKSFSLTPDYAKKNFPDNAPATDEFFYLRSGRPFIVMNDNLMEKVQIPDGTDFNIVQLPNQVTPVSSGVQGQTPSGSVVGGGSVESYGFASKLDQDSADSSPVEITISKPYSLIDIVSTSSAFFAETIAKSIKTEISDPKKKAVFLSKVQGLLQPEQRKALIEKAKKKKAENNSLFMDIDFEDPTKLIEASLQDSVADELSFLANIVPTYNYWPIGKVSQNTETAFTDGGTLENTGIIGLLAQTDTGGESQETINLVVFDNTSTPLETKDGKIIVAGQAAPLFGIDFNDDTGSYAAFTASQKDPKNKDFNPMSLLTVFDNSASSSGNSPFDDLVKGLYAASCNTAAGDKPDPSKITTTPAFHQMELTTVHNPLANVTAGRNVKLLYIQNAKMLNWQNAIGDDSLKSEIVEGQKESLDPFTDFKGFPYYSTFTKIGLEPKESNALSQMWAWAVADNSSPLKKVLQTFIKDAS